MKQVTLKVGKMRKADDCVVYPETRNSLRFVQGERLVLLVDMETGRARVNYRTGSKYPTSWHLQNHPNIEIVQLSPEDIEAIKAATPKSGDHIGGGVFIA